MDEPLVARMRGFGETIFAEMTRLAAETDAINLGQGFPDTDGPRSLLAGAARRIEQGVNQYPPGPGRPELRAAVAADRSARYGLEYDPDTEVYVTVGATAGITAAVLGLVEPGDEVVVFEPMYDSYPAAIAMAGGVRRAVTLRPDPSDEGGRFAFDPDELRAAVGPRTRAVIVNSPHNPTGTVLTEAELGVIAEVCREHDVIAITDEVYEHLTFDGVAHVPLASLPGMRERTLAVSSAGKTFSVTGWKTGWVMGPRPLVDAVRTVNQFLTFTANAALQLAVADALRDEADWVRAQRDALQRKRDRLSAGLRAAGFRVLRPQGTYFVMADIRPLGLSEGVDLARSLPRTAGVAAVPAQVFYDRPDEGRHLVRFAFCKRDEVLDEAVARLAALASA
ncbi:pyridoxal phosphate-dependent aminotransferase [Marinitenerispora sediminis]|uniref:Putative succinyldiaminopimelate transaminase DapC n=1 Tax=Marinitenerispora sediminis TaxID=1931232 RepID=A0A368T7S6_9ACTN|nr:pyridoxal phosphate-dependent aminotransferase [Marinitenerispora sediminis]RCV51128.1 putative succinyldiaminopimelate transaminase DapC [Marinitenerispora sediminis]RCV58343.1 putative succinyldiaminopimelate transaminase DapC [Marinitenerispora sediminis]RCV60147.1 putative succinyldiaminopimelate transaminase DapC [Marinitenerispora sediminis]